MCSPTFIKRRAKRRAIFMEWNWNWKCKWRMAWISFSLAYIEVVGAGTPIISLKSTKFIKIKSWARFGLNIIIKLFSKVLLTSNIREILTMYAVRKFIIKKENKKSAKEGRWIDKQSNEFTYNIYVNISFTFASVTTTDWRLFVVHLNYLKTEKK